MSAGSGARLGAARPVVVAAVALTAFAAAGFAGCGEDEKRFGDERIVEAANLEELDSAYAVGGDPFCTVEPELLNDEAEVGEAIDADERAAVVTSRAGNVGIEGVPPFGPACQRQARKGLNKLDPVPQDE